ncbi:MAG: GNAT family N-acetyltransferase [Burkholderiales bacterium]|nr:GNAT family N-acetyltransferase [Burkholderiales bacterium]
MSSVDYVIRVLDSPLQLPAADWNGLLALQADASPFMRWEYLAALHQSGSALPANGWTLQLITLWHGDTLHAATALYLKSHSYGEYVFDWAWASAYQQHGVPYYPKAVIAVPFTPVPGARLLARDPGARATLMKATVAWCEEQGLSSLHMLFANPDDVAAAQDAKLMLRHTVQFHWTNRAPTLGTGVCSLPPEGERFALGRPGGETVLGYRDFEDFLASLAQDKRKKIRQERRKVADAGVRFRWARGRDITQQDWDFFYRCYERTYYEHGNAPYLSRDFFQRMADTMPENWVLFVAERELDGVAKPVATSLIAISADIDCASGPKSPQDLVAYGRYWGALERVDCLHFEACYYQPLQWCIEHGVSRFEGGAQGEHKMARALLPVKTTSAHWLAHPAFADAVERFLEREGAGITDYLGELAQRSPLRQAD